MIQRLLVPLVASIFLWQAAVAQDGKSCATAIDYSATADVYWTKYTATANDVIQWASDYSNNRKVYEGSCGGTLVGAFKSYDYGCFRCKKGMTYYFNAPDGYRSKITERAEAVGDLKDNPIELRNGTFVMGANTTWLHLNATGDSVASLFFSKAIQSFDVYEDDVLLQSQTYYSCLNLRCKASHHYYIKVYNRDAASVRCNIKKEATGDFPDNPLFITKEKGFAVTMNEQINVWLAYRPAQTGKCSFYVKSSSFVMNSEDAVEVKSTLDTCKAGAPELIQVCGYAKADDTIKVTEYVDVNGVTPQCTYLLNCKCPHVTAALGKNIANANDGISTHLTHFATSYALGYSVSYFIAPREMDLVITDSTLRHYLYVTMFCKIKQNCVGAWIENSGGEATLHCMAGDSVNITWEKHLGDGAESFPFYLIDASATAGAAKSRPITMIPGKSYSVQYGQEVFFRYVVKNRYTRVSLTGSPITLDLLYALNRTSNVFKPGDTIAFHNSLYYGSHPVDPKPIEKQTFRLDTCAIMPGDVDTIPFVLKEGNNIIDQPACFSSTRYYSYKPKRTGYVLVCYGYSGNAQSVVKPCKADSTMHFTSSVIGLMVIREMPVTKGLQPNNLLMVDTGIVTNHFTQLDQLPNRPITYYAYVAPRAMTVALTELHVPGGFFNAVSIKPAGSTSNRGNIALKQGDTLLMSWTTSTPHTELWSIKEVLPDTHSKTKGETCQTAIELAVDGMHEHSFFGKDIDTNLMYNADASLWYKTVVTRSGLFYLEAGTTVLAPTFYKNNCTTKHTNATGTNIRQRSVCLLTAGDTVVFNIENKERVFFYTQESADSVAAGVKRTDTILLHQGMNIVSANALYVKYVPTKDCNVRLIPLGMNQNVSYKYLSAVKKGQATTLSLSKTNWDTLNYRVQVSEFSEQKYNSMQTALPAKLGVNHSTTDTAQFDQWYLFIAPELAYYSVATQNQYQLYFVVKPFNTLTYTKVNLLEKGDTLLMKTNPAYTNAPFTFNVSKHTEPEKAVDSYYTSFNLTHDTSLFVAANKVYLSFSEQKDKILELCYPVASPEYMYAKNTIAYKWEDGRATHSLLSSTTSYQVKLSDTAISKITVRWRDPQPGELPSTAFEARIGINFAQMNNERYSVRYYRYVPLKDGFINCIAPDNRMNIKINQDTRYSSPTIYGETGYACANATLACFKGVPMQISVGGDSLSNWFLHEYDAVSQVSSLSSKSMAMGEQSFITNTNSANYMIDEPAFYYAKQTSPVSTFQQKVSANFPSYLTPDIPNVDVTEGFASFNYTGKNDTLSWQLVKKPLRTTSAIAYMEPNSKLRGTTPLLAQFFSIKNSRNAFTFKFDFEGDGIIDSVVSYLTITQNISHTYTKPGIYSPTIIVSNGVETDTLVLTNNVEVLAADGVCEKPSIISHSLAGDNKYCTGVVFHINAVVRNNEPFSVKKDGKLVAQNVPYYTVPHFDSTHVGYYQIVTKNQCGSDSSAIVHVQTKLTPSIALPDTLAVCNATPVLLRHKDASLALWNNDVYENKTISITQSGYYTAFARNDNGCYSYDSVRIEKDGKPHFSLGKDSTLTQGQSITLQAPKDGHIVWGDGSQASLRTFTYQANSPKQTLTATFTSDYGCVASDTITISFKAQANTAIDNTANNRNALQVIKLYPVPVHTQLSIDAGEQTITQVRVFDAQGKEHITTAANSSSTSIDTHQLAQGIYIVQIETSKGVFRQTISKVE